jgi:hypothetical protein
MEKVSYVYYVIRTMVMNKMLLSEFIKELGSMSNHPNVVALLPKLKRNLSQYGDVEIELDVMMRLMEIKK